MYLQVRGYGYMKQAGQALQQAQKAVEQAAQQHTDLVLDNNKEDVEKENKDV